MSIKEASKQKLKTELELVQAKNDIIRQPTSNWMPTLVEMTSFAFLIAGIMGTAWNMFGVP